MILENITVGQIWNTANGGQVKVVAVHNDSDDYPWIVAGVDGVHVDSTHWMVDIHGFPKHRDGPQLISLAFHAPTTSVKDGNPKEATGDKKVPLWLCSAIAMIHWAAAQFAGLMKYGAWNWRATGVRASTYISAMKRHIARWENGERLDPIDGTHHLGNIMACAAILLEAEAIGKLVDDRSPSADLQKTFDEVEETMSRLKVLYADRKPKHWTIADDTTTAN